MAKARPKPRDRRGEATPPEIPGRLTARGRALRANVGLWCATKLGSDAEPLLDPLAIPFYSLLRPVMPCAGARRLADMKTPFLWNACEPCGRHARYPVSRLIDAHGDEALPVLPGKVTGVVRNPPRSSLSGRCDARCVRGAQSVNEFHLRNRRTGIRIAVRYRPYVHSQLQPHVPWIFEQGDGYGKLIPRYREGSR